MPTWHLRSETVIQAAGMVSVQADCSLDEAIVLMEERAAVAGETRAQIAREVVERLIRFGP